MRVHRLAFALILAAVAPTTVAHAQHAEEHDDRIARGTVSTPAQVIVGVPAGDVDVTRAPDLDGNGRPDRIVSAQRVHDDAGLYAAALDTGHGWCGAFINGIGMSANHVRDIHPAVRVGGRFVIPTTLDADDTADARGVGFEIVVVDGCDRSHVALRGHAASMPRFRAIVAGTVFAVVVGARTTRYRWDAARTTLVLSP